MKSTVMILLILNSGLLFGQTHPFPNHTVYFGNYIIPSNYTQTQLDTQTQLFYDDWKLAYLKNDCGNTNEYYVFSGNGAKNVSEAQGYGMLITAYFAGYDPNAQTFFDGLYRFYKSHPSNINSNLMDWQQISCNDSPSSDDDAASDGDIDIAFALLLAHYQWGSNGTVNYLSEAQTLINAIMQDEINQTTWSVKLGDWSDASDPNYFYGTRPSDFITDHFNTFSCLNNYWNNVRDTCYSLIENIQLNYSLTTGLIPDFIVNVNTNPSPAGANYLEDITDGFYSYNACRVPWRLGTDYLINGEVRAQTAINKINTWLITTTGGNVSSISNGYELNGTAQFNWNDATFIGPFTVGAMLETTNQTWLNNLYDELLLKNDLVNGDYYSNTIKLLSMIVISGNYWTPECSAILSVNDINTKNENILIYPNPAENNISINILLENKNVNYKITDINGKILKDGNLSQNHNIIDITSFEVGIYFISISTNESTFTRKIIKE